MPTDAIAPMEIEAYVDGELMSVAEIVQRVDEIARNAVQTGIRPAMLPLVEVTGGEPLAQPNSSILMEALLDRGYTVLLETSGALAIGSVPAGVHKIVDVKCPSSGESHRNDFGNLALLAPHDEVKFVIGSREDFDFAHRIVLEHHLVERCAAVLFSCVYGVLEPATLSGWLLEHRLWGVRMQLQMHKTIWHPEARGV